jgi:hypothetical protein
MKMRDCPQCKGKMKIGLAVNAQGRTIHPWHCEFCNKAWGSLCASLNDAIEWSKQNGPLKRVLTSTEKSIREGYISISDYTHMTPCEVCSTTGTTEVHHWAPRHLFGAEADKWPMGHLCRKCHQKWHAIVTPNMSRQKGKAA